MTPEIDLATYIGNTVGSLTLATNLFYGNVLAPDPGGNVPDLAVFVLTNGGGTPLAYAGSMTQGEYYHMVQVFIRGNKQDYAEAAALARTVDDAVRYAPIPGYCECKPTQSGIISLGLDKDGHPMLSLNYELISEE